MLRTLSIASAAALAVAAVVVSPAPGFAKETPVERLDRLENAVDQYWNEMRELGGGRTPRELIANVKARMNAIKEIADRLEAAAERAGATVKDLDATRKNFDDTSIFELSDIPQEGAEKVVEEAAKKGLSKVAGRSLGILSFVVDVFEYGGRKVIKEINVSELENLVRQSRAQLSDMYRLLSTLYRDWSNENDKLKRLEDLSARYDAASAELAELRERMRPARSHADTRRTDDAEGDREEQRKFEAERRRRARARMKIELSDGEIPVPPMRPGVHRVDDDGREAMPRQRRASERSDVHSKERSKRTRIRIERSRGEPRRKISSRRQIMDEPRRVRVAKPKFRGPAMRHARRVPAPMGHRGGVGAPMMRGPHAMAPMHRGGFNPGFRGGGRFRMGSRFGG